MKQKLFLYRGVPGSGKTYQASHNPNIDFHFEADDYFWIEGQPFGSFEYCFDSALLPDAHKHCLWKTMVALQKGYSVGVANTFTRIWEMQQYLDFAKDNDIEVVVIRCTGEYENVHGVPANKVKQMKDRFEDYEGEILV